MGGEKPDATRIGVVLLAFLVCYAYLPCSCGLHSVTSIQFSGFFKLERSDNVFLSWIRDM